MLSTDNKVLPDCGIKGPAYGIGRFAAEMPSGDD